MLALQTFGSLELRPVEGGAAACVLAQPKRCAVLLYLALARPRGFLRRDLLLAAFWPELDEGRARNSLSQTLTFLRRHLPAGTVVTRGMEEVGVAPGTLDADVTDLETAFRQERWADVLDIHAGDFLAGFHIPRAPAFEDWMWRERERLRELATRAGWALAWDQLRRGALPEAERTVRVVLGMDGAEEEEIGAFIRELALRGRRAGAITLYQRFIRRLHLTLELEPSPEFRSLLDDLREGPAGEAEGGRLASTATLYSR